MLVGTLCLVEMVVLTIMLWTGTTVLVEVMMTVKVALQKSAFGKVRYDE